VWQLVKSVGRLLRWWWESDRIRAAPSEGRLLRLVPPCLLRVRGEPAWVKERRVLHTATGPCVVYRCAGGAGDFELAVTPAPDGLQLVMRHDGIQDALAVVELEVIPTRPGVSCSRHCSS
jgi:hypothetical protein